MELTWSDDQEQYRDAVRSFLEARAPITRARALAEGDDVFDRDLWADLASQLGAQSLAVSEGFDGAGAGLAEQLIVLEEMGRVLYGGPYLSTVISTALLSACAGSIGAKYFPGIADGSLVAVVAEAESGRSFDISALSTIASGSTGTVEVTGVKRFVFDAAAADVLLVTAQSPVGPVIVAIESRQDGVEVAEAKTLDQTRRLSTVTLTAASGLVVAGPAATPDIVRHAHDVAVAGLAAEQLGAAERCLELTVEYTRTREQFGRPVGSFQALKHRLADVLISVEMARSAVLYVAWAAVEQPEELGIAASVAGAQNSATLLQAAQETVQMHGGIGYTWEHDAHLYLRRAKSSHVLFGSPVHHRGRLADLVEL